MLIVPANTFPDEAWYIFNAFCAVACNLMPFVPLPVVSARLAIKDILLWSFKLWKQIQLPIRQAGSLMEMLVARVSNKTNWNRAADPACTAYTTATTAWISPGNIAAILDWAQSKELCF